VDTKTLSISLGLEPAKPLWKVAPTRDENGNRVGDLLMIIPKLKSKPKHHVQKTLTEIESVLKQFRSLVLFANVDMKLNTLWVSFKAKPGLFIEIASALKLRVPEAVIVGDIGPRLNK
jgi:hypothetical protein